jgi:hypothetical protein
VGGAHVNTRDAYLISMERATANAGTIFCIFTNESEDVKETRELLSEI